MSSSSLDTVSKTVSATTIIAAVVSTVLGVSSCIACIVIIVCVIKYCNKPRNTTYNGMIHQPYAPYPNNVPDYPPAYTNYPPQYPSNVPTSSIYPKVPPPYPTSEREQTRIENP